jgi:hypothetical protein
VNWLNRALLSINIALALLFIYLIFFRASYARVPIEWSRTDAITIVLASLAVVLAALTIFLAVLAIWGYTGLREHATRMATEDAVRTAREIAATVATRAAETVIGRGPGETAALRAALTEQQGPDDA